MTAADVGGSRAHSPLAAAHKRSIPSPADLGKKYPALGMS